VFAFANVLFIQLGPNMAEFASPLNSFVTLGRALFGDFDLDLIIDNSPDCASPALCAPSAPRLALLRSAIPSWPCHPPYIHP